MDRVNPLEKSNFFPSPHSPTSSFLFPLIRNICRHRRIPRKRKALGADTDCLHSALLLLSHISAFLSLASVLFSSWRLKKRHVGQNNNSNPTDSVLALPFGGRWFRTLLEVKCFNQISLWTCLYPWRPSLLLHNNSVIQIVTSYDTVLRNLSQT